jgi:hypothetical protein
LNLGEGLAERFDPAERPFEQVGHIRFLSFSVDQITRLVPGYALAGSGGAVNGSKIHNNILEAEPPGV